MLSNLIFNKMMSRSYFFFFYSLAIVVVVMMVGVDGVISNFWRLNLLRKKRPAECKLDMNFIFRMLILCECVWVCVLLFIFAFHQIKTHSTLRFYFVCGFLLFKSNFLQLLSNGKMKKTQTNPIQLNCVVNLILFLLLRKKDLFVLPQSID